jgi:hypothetical protein
VTTAPILVEGPYGCRNRYRTGPDHWTEVAGRSAFVYGFSSGVNPALLAAERGLAIPRIAMLEPPLQVGDAPPSESNLAPRLVVFFLDGQR